LAHRAGWLSDSRSILEPPVQPLMLECLTRSVTIPLVPDRIQLTTGSGVEYAPRLLVNKIEALGQERVNFPVVAHTLPPSASVDGLLGLDFFRGQELNVDFREGIIMLS